MLTHSKGEDMDFFTSDTVKSVITLACTSNSKNSLAFI